MAYCRKFQILSILEHIDSNTHASENARSLTILDAIKFLNRSWNNISVDTIEKCFKKCGFVKDVNDVVEEPVEILKQINEPEEIAKTIGIAKEQLVFEEMMLEFEIPEIEKLGDVLIKEFYDEGSLEEENMPLFENQNINKKEIACVIKDDEAIEYIEQLIRYAKEKNLHEREIDLMEMKYEITKA